MAITILVVPTSLLEQIPADSAMCQVMGSTMLIALGPVLDLRHLARLALLGTT